MQEIIKSEIKKVKDYYLQSKQMNLTDDRAFSHVILNYYFGMELDDQLDCVTDGPNDGGIDFLYYDEDENKVVLCQAKCTSKLDNNTIISELDKMASTIKNFEIGNTSMYNDKLKIALQNSLDRLPEDSAGNVEYNLFTTADIDVNSAIKKIGNTTHAFSVDAIVLLSQEDIENKIMDVQETLQIVLHDKVIIDKANNCLEYESNDSKGIMVNVLSSSIVALYNKYASKGLFDLNIRKYIKNTLVDSGIKNTLDKDRANFWFLNNGIIIACEDFDPDGNTIKLDSFSIVNGGQTTTLISTYKSKDNDEFYIPCKIIAQKKQDDDMLVFFTQIAEASNSQKPIFARDLKSNAPEMVRFARWLGDYGIFLEIKRGIRSNKKYRFSMKNDELGQLILSMVFQQPGTSRSGKKTIFEKPNVYGKIYKVNYAKDQEKKQFIIDLIDLYERYSQIEEKLKKSDELTEMQMEVLKNGKQIMFAIFGTLYRIENGDITEQEIKKEPQVVKNVGFTYGGFISNYKKDDLNEKIENVIKGALLIISDGYTAAYKNGLTTSVSNYFKTDSKYYETILPNFMMYMSMAMGKEIKNSYDFLKR
ncbi:AIPR family protein [Candidatus Galacturonibacter soehngenii]|uniref:Abortive phage infection protein C-terminal domain-containing protein n=1 Tax=Candidatus Galacturonatibacter soehngenii TaxID=2307010 RepID=A0A7V7QHB8_9FIRM|nr:AIPR family protein [Candidatus Galacturonibacter soehngenii]KAB1434308.1 hypothetical protein F7O84_17620 [Candidatus Galacturonibacter soehngenii]